MTAPADVSEVQDAAADAMDELVHLPRCDDGDTAMCGTDLTGADWSEDGPDCVVCEELDRLYPCVCADDCVCCTGPSLVIFDEVHYFTGGTA